MRHLVLALMILLLPLRGWVGDAMATDMAISMTAGMAVTTKIIAVTAHNKGASGQFEHKFSAKTAPSSAAQTHTDCGGHASVEAAPSAGAHDTQEEHCEPCQACQACQACHTVALSPLAARFIAIFNPASQPDARALPFVNADAALSKKPPIS